jgi:hypothetical protein
LMAALKWHQSFVLVEVLTECLYLSLEPKKISDMRNCKGAQYKSHCT